MRKIMRKPFIPFQENRFGFGWGAAKIERITSLNDGSIVMAIVTRKEIVHIRVTKSGLIRITPIEMINR